MNIHSFLLPPNATKITEKGKTHEDKENARGCIIITDLADLRKLTAKLAVGRAKKNLIYNAEHLKTSGLNTRYLQIQRESEAQNRRIGWKAT